MTEQSWDVVIVGAGSSGLPAAIFAAQRGARVLQIEADSKIGGTLYLSSGQMAAAGTRVQRELGIEDSPEAHYADAQRITGNTIDPVLGKLAIDNAAETLDWLIDIGFQLAAEAPQCGVTHEPYTTRRYFWGNNVAVSILEEALAPAHEALVAAGKIDLRLNTRMTRLLIEGDAVVGVEATDGNGATHEFRAANVALTSGGYAANPELWARTNPDHPLCSHTNAFSRGDGLLAAEALGAKVDGGEKYLSTFAGWRDEKDNPLSGNFIGLAPNARKPWEIYVDGNGKRFMREDCQSIDYLENSLLRQPGTKMFLVSDEGIWRNAPPMTLLPEAEYRGKFGNHYNFLKADTLAGLAAQMDVDAGNLENTVAAFNEAVDAGMDPEFGREFLLRKIEKGPFYALGAQGITVVSPAGLNADDQLRVLKDNGEPIPNLYAAGEVLGFTRLSGNAFVGGMSLTPAMTFGRLLGQEIIQW
jgi:fumarate reductase flavoprotein subunit